MTVHLLGIRHHGPGSARSVLRALGEVQPDIVLVHLGTNDIGQMGAAGVANADLNLAHDGSFGSMTGLEWLEGYGGHEALHHPQIDRLIQQVSGADDAR